jgi:hypothetical protein
MKSFTQRAKWRNPIDGDLPWYDIGAAPASMVADDDEWPARAVGGLYAWIIQPSAIILKSKEN